MKKLILGVVIIGLFLSGCGKIYPMVPLSESNREYHDSWIHSNGKRQSYKLIGAYVNNKTNKKELQEILEKAYAEYAAKKDTFKTGKKLLKEDERYRRCNLLVESNAYGRYRNAIEQDTLIQYCEKDLRTLKMDYATGKKFYTELSNPNNLRVDVKFVYRRNVISTRLRLHIKDVDERIFFYITMDEVIMQKTYEGGKFVAYILRAVKESGLTSENPINTNVKEFLF